MNDEKEVKKPSTKRNTTSSKKKTTTTKSSTSTKKTTKKSTPPKSTEAKKSTTTKKVSAKSTSPKKTTSKKAVTKSTPKKEEPSVSKAKKSKILISEEVNATPLEGRELSAEEKKEYLNNDLERTIIIDGDQARNLKEVVQNLEERTIYKENRPIQRNPLKKYLILFLSISIAILVIATTIYVVKNLEDKEEKTNDNIYEIVKKETKDKNLSLSVKMEDTSYEHIKEINLSSLEQYVLERKNFNLVVFSSTCFACAKYEPVLEQVLENREEVIYRIDVTKLEKEEIVQLRKYYAYETTPTILKINNGQIISELVGRKDEEELTKWLSSN